VKKVTLPNRPTTKSISDASEQPKETRQRTPEEQLAVAIRELRQSLSLTQVQLAMALGMTPTSIYRYEAGSSFPDVNTLALFWQFSITKESPAAIAFTAILASAVPALQPVLEASFELDPGGLASATESRLTPQEGLLVMAFMKLLHAPPTDPVATMARKVSETLLEPWYEQSKKELSQQIQKHFRQTFRSAKQTTETQEKPVKKK
jgi:DNA-binding XRE family transcriptional regulator